MDYDERPPRPVARQICDVCQQERNIPLHWQKRICQACRDGQPDLRRCSRCGLHKAVGKGWGSTHCPPCHRLDAKESRARRKEQLKDAPPPPPEMRTCTKCGVEHLYPCPGWRDRTCPPCTRQYQRGYKLTHAPKMAPDVRLEKSQYKRCSHCRQRVLYHPREKWKGDICGGCHKKFQKTARTNRRAQVVEWRENQTPIECRTCLETSPYGVGWDWNQCPECVSARAKAAYALLKASPERLAHRNKVQAAAEVKRAVKRNQKSRESTHGGVSAAPSPEGGVRAG